MTRFVNLTSHEIRLYTGNADDAYYDKRAHYWITIDPEPIPARVDQWTDTAEWIGGIRTLTVHIRGTMNLPDPEPGVIYITSSLIARNVIRRDVVAPDTDYLPIVDEYGKLYAVRRFKRWVME